MLFRSGMIRLKRSIYWAIETNCDVISISLGWLENRGVHRALKEAVKRDIIVCAAAGNYVGFVVWPAAYPETIAVAGCTSGRQRWSGSSRGEDVDISAPAKNVWRAYIEDGEQVVSPSDGTSYAVATTAGLAALWLAFHGKNALLKKYRESPLTLNEVFRKVLQENCDRWPLAENDGNFGPGIINAKRTLEGELPEGDSEKFFQESALSSKRQASRKALLPFVRTFENLSESEVCGKLCQMMKKAETEVDDLLGETSEEVKFHILTNPILRERFLSGESKGVPVGELFQGALITTEEDLPAPGEQLYEEFCKLEDLSNCLQKKLELKT